MDQLAPDELTLRPATRDDVATIATHRASMFRDMGEIDADGAERLRRSAEERIGGMLERGEYVGWVAVDPTGEIVAGAGVQLRAILPRPAGRGGITTGPEALVLNVYTEPAWRRRGVARRLMERVMEWAATSGVERLVLHASEDGRALYESLGFALSNEMRLPAERLRGRAGRES